MKHITLLLICISIFSTQSMAQLTIENPRVEQYFDFWIGEWEVVWDEGNGKKGKGINRVVKILDDKVVQENFEIFEGQNAGFKGTSISVYQSQFGQWKQSWADSNGDFYNFTGYFDAGKRIFRTSMIELKDGRKLVYRMVFYDIKRDSITWDWESSFDGGETWVLNWRILYKRKK